MKIMSGKFNVFVLCLKCNACIVYVWIRLDVFTDSIRQIYWLKKD